MLLKSPMCSSTRFHSILAQPKWTTQISPLDLLRQCGTTPRCWYVLFLVQIAKAEQTRQTVCVFSILLPRGKLRLICGIILVQLFLGVLWGAQSTVQAYALANQTIMLLLRWIDLMIIHDPEKDFWRVENPPKEKGDDWTPSGTKTVNGTWTKLKWWTVLLINQR